MVVFVTKEVVFGGGHGVVVFETLRGRVWRGKRDGSFCDIMRSSLEGDTGWSSL